MKNLKIYIALVATMTLGVLSGCKKDFLDKKPNSNIVIPETLDDMTQLLDNTTNNFNTPAMGIMSGEDYYYPTIDSYNSLPKKTSKNCYTWNKDIYGGETAVPDWNKPYSTVFTANVVLEQWDKLSVTDKQSTSGKYVKAWALFSRSFSLYNLVQIFAPAYNKATAGNDLGIPLKLTANINDIQPRASVQAVYDRILSDLNSSIELYPASFPANNLNRSSKASTYALLSRIYLSMREYDKALAAANNSLAARDELVDFNTLDTTATSPFTIYNPELVYTSFSVLEYFEAIGALYANHAAILPEFLQLYDKNDLRKQIYFYVNENNFFVKSGYGGNTYWPFMGLAVDELYLIKAECLSRGGDQSGATDALNKLLVKRYVSGTFVPLTVGSADEVLNKILLERRKELVWRGLRWSDIKRLNLEGANITLTRTLDGKTYTLAPNSPLYVMPIPSDEIALSHIQQNQR
ncbi:SusD-like starch-binding protein associating with outer membrane [Mucilaginibacter gracilis]|uniref:SusD-like starch-binding protein associating with outer membrane n=1 Tax=Mucilaginibacter gracilis TaxID=423350 RepID=A0A495IZH0_9SPHI|nr:RagB/SusD family nutrient uptake outer membrane protein [Mucilaginibacter gracilis]RKR82087.1 SusD-like starch-binding protein associating with outer membrane [Mucilaginibacter gracilis]